MGDTSSTERRGPEGSAGTPVGQQANHASGGAHQSTKKTGPDTGNGAAQSSASPTFRRPKLYGRDGSRPNLHVALPTIKSGVSAEATAAPAMEVGNDTNEESGEDDVEMISVPGRTVSAPAPTLPPGNGVEVDGIQQSASFPPQAAKEALRVWKAPNRPSVIAPQAAYRAPGHYGYTPRSNQFDAVEADINTGFIGAELCGCIVIDKFLMAGGFGRGWEGTYTRPDKTTTKVFVKTLGVLQSDEKSSHARSAEMKAAYEAEVYTHPWFAAAVDHGSCASARLCYGMAKNQKSNFANNIFFICGELCKGGDLWAYMLHSEALEERFAKRIFGQLARGLRAMKHCGEPQTRAGARESATQLFRAQVDARIATGPVVKGCFHRDLKLENIIVTDKYDCKIMDYGSLKFTDGTGVTQEVTPDGSVFYNSKTPWLGTDCFKPPSFFYSSPYTIAQSGYDPAAWDVWSAGTILMYMCAGDVIYSKLKGHVYRFFELAMQECPADAQQAKVWRSRRRAIGNQCLFYDTDDRGRALKIVDGIPQVPRDKNGVPINARLWKYLFEIDPDAARPGPRAWSRNLKNLVNRMLDVDPRKRITIEEICEHPWLNDHQSPVLVSGPSVETPEENEAFVAEMSRRYVTWVDKKEANSLIKAAVSFDDAVHIITKCLRDNDSHKTVQATPTANSPVFELGIIEVFREKVAESSTVAPSLPIFRARVHKDFIKLEWVSNVMVKLPNGEMWSAAATLAEWHHFLESVKEAIQNPSSPDGESDRDSATPTRMATA
eukprot:m.524836 g.524836  ORF g.524836 m.524836 type:complete len:776 (+) comp21993_c0_seq1:180-2507(+)